MQNDGSKKAIRSWLSRSYPLWELPPSGAGYCQEKRLERCIHGISSGGRFMDIVAGFDTPSFEFPFGVELGELRIDVSW